jgi:hypothetical protein
MTNDGKAVGNGLELWSDFLNQLASVFKGLFGRIGEHRASVLINNLDIETLLGFLEHNVFRGLNDLGHVLKACRSEAEASENFRSPLKRAP